MRRNFTHFVLFCLAFGCCLNQSAAQDARLSQFYAAPLQVNPAMIGVFDGQSRVVVNYRELYASVLKDNPFRTLAASFDMRFRVMRGDYAGFGLSVMRDEVGVANFNRVRANLGGSFLKQLNGSRYSRSNQYLVVGAQLGIGQRGFDWGKLWFTNQFNIDQALVAYSSDPGENFDHRKTNVYLDFNAGLLWYALFDNDMSVYVGGSMHHLNEPNISFLGDDSEKLYSKWVGNAGGEIPFTNNLSLLPAIAVMGQGPSFSATFGGNFRFTNRDWKEVAIRAGAWGHMANQLESSKTLDAMIFTAILEIERWNFGVSYDVTVSTLASANNSRGAFELSLIYTSKSKDRVRTVCPKF